MSVREVESDEKLVVVRSISKSYGRLKVIEDVSFAVDTGESVALLGPSGCGKTTALRIIAGLEPDFSGTVDRYYKKIGYVFQEPRLIPWKSVWENLRFVSEDEAEIGKTIQLMRLSGFEHFKPAKLSGGMRQRVNLARALVVKPDLLLLDEPFSSLDVGTKLGIIQDLLTMRKSFGLSMLIVTHDLREALLLADRVLLMSDKPSVIVKEYKTGDVPKDILDPQFLEREREILGNVLNIVGGQK